MAKKKNHHVELTDNIQWAQLPIRMEPAQLAPTLAACRDCDYVKANEKLLHCPYTNTRRCRVIKTLRRDLHARQDRRLPCSEGQIGPLDVMWLRHLCHSLN